MRRIQIFWRMSLLMPIMGPVSCGADGHSSEQETETSTDSSSEVDSNANSDSDTNSDADTDAEADADSDTEVVPNDKSCKRGVALEHGKQSDADMAALSVGVSWWYNWAPSPDQGLDTAISTYQMAYVPMWWGTGTPIEDVDTAIRDDDAYILGFNEPNFFSQSNLSAVDAAAFLEGEPRIARYAWFAGRVNGMTNVNLLEGDTGSGALSSLGETYISLPFTNDSCE